MTLVLITEILKQVKERLKSVIPSPKYELIVEPIQVESVESGKVVILVAGQKQAQWLQEEFLQELIRAFQLVLGEPCEVEIKVAPSTELKSAGEEVSSSAVPLSEVKAIKKPRPLLNPRFTFENFVVGDSNQFSYAASRAVAENPGSAYNPLFIYADVGLGKTHLLHAIGHHVLSINPEMSVVYLTSEKFTADFIEKVRAGKMNEFRLRYRQCDLLLIDDIQFIAGKTETQMEFFHTFMSSVDSGKQIVITSDAPPYDLKGIESRLVSRFASGLIVDIGSPGIETRIAILQKKAELESVTLPEDVLTFIAENVTTNIRHLEGALIRVLAFCNFSGAKCTLEVARKVLADMLSVTKGKRLLTMEEIITAICEVFRVPKNVLLSKDRRKKVAEARMLAMYIAREQTNLTLAQIGEELGARDHSTVSHGIMKSAILLDEDPYFKQLYQMIIRKLG